MVTAWRSGAAILSVAVWAGVVGFASAAGALPTLGLSPDHGMAGDPVSVTYDWVGCGSLAANFYVVNVYWDTTKNPPLATANLMPYPYSGAGDCGAKIDTFSPKDAPPGGHTLLAQVSDLKANVQAGSEASAPFTIDGLKATPTPPPKATPIPPPQATLTEAPGATVTPAPKATTSPAASGPPGPSPVGPISTASPPILPLLAVLLGGSAIAVLLVLRPRLWRPGGKGPGLAEPLSKRPEPEPGAGPGRKPQPSGQGGEPTGSRVPPSMVPPMQTPSGPSSGSPFHVPQIAPRPIPLRPRSAPASCDFSQGEWTITGNAFDEITGTTMPSEEVRIAGQPLVPLGGDYWHVPYRRGNIQGFWYGSRLGPERDRATGLRTSREFTIDFNYLSFLISGNRDPERLRVELQIQLIPEVSGSVAGAAISAPLPNLPLHRVETVTGDDSDRFRQIVWDVRKWRGRLARVHLVDESREGHIDIADLECSQKEPEPFIQPIWGWADMHSHPMANVGFGGQLIWPSAGGAISDLVHCEPIHGIGGTFFGTNLLATFATLGTGLMPFLSLGLPENGAINTGFGHLTGGYPEFDGWPKHTSLIHQTMHWDWVRRAFDGGQRLLVALVVNSELLAAFTGGPWQGDDDSMRAQLEGWRATIPPWAEVALTPQDARRIIGEDRLAIVLGLEVDRALGSWATQDDLGATEIDRRVRIRERLLHLRALGIRQLNPIHLTNNAFGAAAVYREEFNLGNAFVRGDWFQVEGQPPTGDPETIGFRFGAGVIETSARHAILNMSHPTASPILPPYDDIGPGHGHRNVSGLTPAGFQALYQMRELGMIIDIDHMSEHSTADTLMIYQPIDYPVVSAHATFRELSPRRRWGDEDHPRSDPLGETFERKNPEYWPHESEKTPRTMLALAALRGVVAPLTGGMLDRRPFGGQVANDCAGSSKTWAQEFLYARGYMGDRGVALGTDAVALLAQPGARFGPQVAWGLRPEDDTRQVRRDQAARQGWGVTYAGNIRDYRAYRFATTDVVDQEERDIWEATAIVKAGLNPWRPDQQPDGPGIFNRTQDVQNKINNIAKGLLATSESQLEHPFLFGGDTYNEQYAAFLVGSDHRSSIPGTPPPALYPTVPERVRQLFPRIWTIWNTWTRMELRQVPGGAVVTNNAPLTRSVAGRRDFDINIDGVAHYGMLVDFLQDARNVGLSAGDMSVLFQSAEDYIEVWERCEAVRATFPLSAAEARIT